MILFKPIKPVTQFKSSIFRDTFKAQAAKLAPKIKADFDKTTATFKTRPQFKSEISVGRAAGGGVSIEVTTDDEIYGYLDKGTKVRYATMSKDFRAKTQPRVIGSRAGRGKRLFVSKKRPRPGITARKFSETIKKKWASEFREQMAQALKEAASKSGHARTK